MKIIPFVTGSDLGERQRVADAFEECGLGPYMLPNGIQIPFNNTNTLDAIPDGYIRTGGYSASVASRKAERTDAPKFAYANIDYEPTDGTWETGERPYTTTELHEMSAAFAEARIQTNWRLGLYGLPFPGPGHPTNLQGANLRNARKLFWVCRPDWLMVHLYVTHSIHYGDRTERHQTLRMTEAIRRMAAIRPPWMPLSEIIPYFQVWERGADLRPLHPEDAHHWFRTCMGLGVAQVGWWIVGSTTDPENPAKTVDGHIDALKEVAPRILDALKGNA